ncbi:unnamed protein product, partial [Mesorhabditis spiculigera]
SNSLDEVGQEVQITIYPTEAQIRDGKDASFDCRARTADNSVYPPVRWTKVGGPLPPNARESSGRLTISPVSASDSGSYVCQAVHNGQTVEATANLNVLSFGPQELQGILPTSKACGPDERQCGNNECVKNEYVCDGEPDCRDRSDELNCPAMRQCEPNEHRCNNQRCVQKMWLCDGDDDCGDGSDEVNCGHAAPGDTCKKTEFKCHDGQQCVPSSFHCDGTNDCRDGSDEIGCVQPTVVEPPEPRLHVQRGATFELKCKAVAVPEPYINWRLNWGPVCEPPRCVQTSEGGVGVLTVQDAQPLDQGAYTCEAINVKGRVLATPDCIVQVGDGDVQPPPPPPPPPSRPGFLTYNEQCHEKYWRLPQRFLGNKVTAYGGKMEFEIDYQGTGTFTPDPMVVLKGNQIILVHRVRDQEHRLQAGRPARITIETYESNWEQLNGAPATREDLMMVLADLDGFLIRAHHVEEQDSTSS